MGRRCIAPDGARSDRRGRAVGNRTIRAAVRAWLVMAVVATPALMRVDAVASDIVLLAALAGGILTFAEYAARGPAFVEFRDAPPYNRIRLAALAGAVVCSAMACAPDRPVGALLRAVGEAAAHLADWPGSPMRALLAVVDPDRAAGPAGLSLLCCAVAVTAFARLSRGGWPGVSGRLNLWTNLPTFDGLDGPEAALRLRRDARFNVLLGVGGAYLAPTLAAGLHPMHGLSVQNDLVLVWTVALWAFLPTACFLRAIALARVAAVLDGRSVPASSPSLA